MKTKQNLKKLFRTEQLESPTTEQAFTIQAAFEYFNATLFNNELPNCILNFDWNKKNVLGSFRYKVWKKNKDIVNEISLNPKNLNKALIDTMATLVHEMCHLWQCEFGKKIPSNGYHNKEFSHKMFEVGLMTSSTGHKGGNPTGHSMSHYIFEGGIFESTFDKMPREYKLPWLNTKVLLPRRDIGRLAEQKLKLKYQCPRCGNGVWGRPNLRIICGDCMQPFAEVLNIL